MTLPSRSRLSFQAARDTLDDLARLLPDWDSYGAAPPTAVAISAAHGLLANVAKRYVDASDEDALPWATAPLADGGVQFEWRGPGGAVEVEIGPDGAMTFLREKRDQTVDRSAPGAARVPDLLEQIALVVGR
jgi:hypothetical protein